MSERQAAAYAAKTKVSVIDTIDEIRSIVGRYGGSQFTYGLGEDQAVIAFSKADRQVRFYVALGNADAQRRKSLLRALLLVIKAKLEAAEAGIMTFEEAFLAQITLPDGRSVGNMVRDELALAYGGGKEPPRLLPNYTEAR